jgi:hypothetical protein
VGTQVQRSRHETGSKLRPIEVKLVVNGTTRNCGRKRSFAAPSIRYERTHPSLCCDRRMRPSAPTCPRGRSSSSAPKTPACCPSSQGALTTESRRPGVASRLQPAQERLSDASSQSCSINESAALSNNIGLVPKRTSAHVRTLAQAAFAKRWRTLNAALIHCRNVHRQQSNDV